MTDLLEKLDSDYLLGCIRYQNRYCLYAMPLPWWILNYSKYDPDSSLSDFRNGVINVADSEIENFFEAIESDKVTADDFKLAADESSESLQIQFFIDFDAKLFINGYYENVEPESYLPDAAWHGEMGFPINHLPDDFKIQFDGLS